MKLTFWANMVGPWRTPSGHDIEFDERERHLFFTYDQIDPDLFDLLNGYNTAEFLEVPAEQLRSTGIYVTAIHANHHHPDVGQVLLRLVQMNFLECASMKYTESPYYPTRDDMDAGKARRRRIDLFSPVDMAKIVGERNYPLRTCTDAMNNFLNIKTREIMASVPSQLVGVWEPATLAPDASLEFTQDARCIARQHDDEPIQGTYTVRDGIITTIVELPGVRCVELGIRTG